MAKTLYDKLWESHVVDTEKDGTTILYIDRHSKALVLFFNDRPVYICHCAYHFVQAECLLFKYKFSTFNK